MSQSDYWTQSWYDSSKSRFANFLTSWKIQKLQRDFTPYRELWTSASDWTRWFDMWMNDSFNAIDPEGCFKRVIVYNYKYYIIIIYQRHAILMWWRVRNTPKVLIQLKAFGESILPLFLWLSNYRVVYLFKLNTSSVISVSSITVSEP